MPMGMTTIAAETTLLALPSLAKAMSRRSSRTTVA
jgi:hypothetical protein